MRKQQINRYAGIRRLAAVFGVVTGLVGCVNAPPRPDNPYFAPVPPAAMTAPKQVTGAIYQSGYGLSLYEDRRARRVGDILTINLTERTQASKKAETDIEKSSSLTLPQPTILGRGVSILGNPLSATLNGGTRTANGSGDADQSNSLTGSITVTVADVLPSGVMQVRGEKWMTLTSGDEYIRVSGLVRPEDVKPDNSVDSPKLADARITYSGTGALHDSNQPGWLTRFFYSPLWPF